MSGTTREVLVPTATGIRLDSGGSRQNLKVTNNGPNAIYVNLLANSSTGAAVGSKKGHTIAAGATMDFIQCDTQSQAWAIADTALQVTGAATVVSEW